MNWPRGRYNGRRIVGVDFKITIDITEWRLIPMIGHGCGMFHWLCWRAWINPAYEDR